MTKPKSLTGLSDAAKSALNGRFTSSTLTEIVKKSDIDAAGGYAFTVFSPTYTDKEGNTVAFPGEAVSGFGVKVTLVQTTTTNSDDAKTSVEITSESQPMGSLQVMKNEGNGKYTLAGDTITVRSKYDTNEYRLVVLKQNVAADRASYKAADFAPATSFSFTPDKVKGSVYVDTNGWITVNKLGKAPLAAVDKSDRKNKKDVKVTFVQTAAPLELQISKYEGSALSTVQYAYYDSFEFSGNNNTIRQQISTYLIPINKDFYS